MDLHHCTQRARSLHACLAPTLKNEILDTISLGRTRGTGWRRMQSDAVAEGVVLEQNNLDRSLVGFNSDVPFERRTGLSWP